MSKIKWKELGLNQKQAAFCKYWLLLMNGNEAAIKAGYSKKTARIMASQLLTKLNIQEYIAHLRKNTEDVVGISKQMMVSELKKLALSNVSEVFNDWIEKKDFEELPEKVRACISEIQTQVKKVPISIVDENGNISEVDSHVEFVKVKFYDKNKAIETINKMMGYNEPEKVDVLERKPTKITFE